MAGVRHRRDRFGIPLLAESGYGPFVGAAVCEGLCAKHANRRVGACEFRTFAVGVSGKPGGDIGRDAASATSACDPRRASFALTGARRGPS